MNVFYFDYLTGEYRGQGNADPHPLNEGQWIIPGYSTPKAPPTMKANQAAVFDKAADKWLLVADFRGQVYWLADGSEHRISTLGVTKPADALDTKPAPPPPTAEELTAQAIADRKTAYVSESDPLYMEWQYDGTAESEQLWRDTVAEIKARYPLPSEQVISP